MKALEGKKERHKHRGLRHNGKVNAIYANCVVRLFCATLCAVVVMACPRLSSGAIFVDVPTTSRSAPELGVQISSNSVPNKDVREIRTRIVSDLKSTGLISFKKDTNGDAQSYKFALDEGDLSGVVALAQKEGMDYLVDIRIEQDKEGSISAIVKLIDIIKPKQISSRKYAFNVLKVYKIAHTIADNIMVDMFGYQEYFDSRILHIASFGSGGGDRGANANVKKVGLMNRDGTNMVYLNDFSMVMKPSYSKERKEMLYVTYKGGDARVKVVDIAAGKTVDLSDVIPKVKGKQVISPTISKDGTTMLFSICAGYNTDIYVYNTHTKSLKKITKGGINVSPSFSPGGQEFVFNSNINGKSELYISGINGKKTRKISQHGGAYREPKWSPDGKLIAFTKMSGNRFYIGVMDANGSNEKILYGGYMVESPSWSPSGRSIVFSHVEAKGEKAGLKVIDIDGRELMSIRGDANLLDPFWFAVGQKDG